MEKSHFYFSIPPPPPNYGISFTEEATKLGGLKTTEDCSFQLRKLLETVVSHSFQTLVLYSINKGQDQIIIGGGGFSPKVPLLPLSMHLSAKVMRI